MESGGDEASESGEQWDLLASRFVKGSYCAYSFILTVVIAGIGQLIATLVLEPCRAAARHRSQVSTVRNEIRVKNWKKCAWSVEQQQVSGLYFLLIVSGSFMFYDHEIKWAIRISKIFTPGVLGFRVSTLFTHEFPWLFNDLFMFTVKGIVLEIILQRLQGGFQFILYVWKTFNRQNDIITFTSLHMSKV